MRITAMVVYILIGARTFSLVFQGVGGKEWIEHLLTSLPGGQIGFLIFVNVFIFVIAFFLDFFEIAFIIIPLLAPVADKLGIDLIWFGVLICANMQTSFMHPPFGFALFYLRGIAPASIKSTRNLLGRDPLGGAAGHPGGDRDLLAGLGDLLARPRDPRSIPSKIKIEIQQPDMPPPLDLGEPPNCRVSIGPGTSAPKARLSEHLAPIDYAAGCDCAPGSCRRSVRRPATTDTRRCGTRASLHRPS